MTLTVESHYTPVVDEIDAFDLPVDGVLPPELSGRYLRNGPNPVPGAPPRHPFAEPGMVHGVRIRDGRALWYRNRWVRTSLLAGAPRERADGSRDLAACTANTHVIEHAGRIFALVESGLPYELDGDLTTVGAYDFGGRLTTAMTAHPKADPVTGELHFFGYGTEPPFLTYHRLSAAGELVESREVDVPAATMMHDFAITEDYVVWLDLPVVHDKAIRGLRFRWSETHEARLGVMPRAGGAVRWFSIDPCYVFHVGNARQDAQGRVVLDAVRYEPVAFAREWSVRALEVEAAPPGPSRRLYRWTLDPVTGRASESPVDDWLLEFPTVNDNRVGLPYRFLYLVGHPDGTDEQRIVRLDTASGVREVHSLRPGELAGEAVFVPAADGVNEDDGWLISIVSNRNTATSDLVVLDATDVRAAPVATVHLPRWVPAGFHGSWIADEEDV
ncbi:carotenoid oxygenase family protein [Fodinicola acaciae]|uniref:carotenoid oxygenase family protein n=1 Tax=Fodinicola acaciae TaxID=2681555 RepID=UPI0013D525F3|nr:carotenoid oxygenase family protein [Fodinicola acaciae]